MYIRLCGVVISMVFSKKDKETQVVFVNCNCGCDEALQIKHYTYDKEIEAEDEYYLSLLAGRFSTDQRGVFKTIFGRIKAAWKMLIGKEYHLTEIVMTKTEYKDLIDKLEELYERK